MAYSKIKASAVPKRKRLSVSRFERTVEWKALKADIDKGLKPQEALQVVLTDSDKKKYKISNRRTCARFVKKYIKSQGLPYTVKSFRRDDGEYVIVNYAPVIRQTA